MSTFAELELSIFGGKPVELYRFSHGSDVWTYCASNTSITHNEEIYAPTPVGRSAISQESEIAKDTITVSVPLPNEVSQLFLSGSPENAVGLTIFRLHAGGDGVVCIWKGRAAMATWNENRCELACQSIFSKQKQGGRGPRYTKQCRVDLYGPQCGVNKEDFAVAATISAIDSSLSIVTCSAAGAQADGYFVSGMLQYGGSIRTIIRHDGNNVTISSPIPGMAVGNDITIYPGCDRSLEVCNARFDNIANNRSFAWIPSDNPFIGSVV